MNGDIRVGIHQINYFPWLGYFNKIAKSDKFILLDDVQLVDNNMMQRNRYLNKNGQPEFITIAFNKKNYLSRKFREIELNSNIDWRKRQFNALYDTYHKFPYWNETSQIVEDVFSYDSYTLMGINLYALKLICEKLEIYTPFIFQSKLSYDFSLTKDALLIALLKQVNADTYLSGSGAKKYMIIDDFRKENINVQFQTFTPPVYTQKKSSVFVPGLSILDMLFNCGIDETKRLFYGNMCENEITE